VAVVVGLQLLCSQWWGVGDASELEFWLGWLMRGHSAFLCGRATAVAGLGLCMGVVGSGGLALGMIPEGILGALMGGTQTS